ncbi:hypothetical protein CL616_02425 [archaeon]|nr:hypothetical protein [archaeon]
MLYKHTQKGNLIIFVIIALIIYFSFIASITDYNTIIIITITIVILILASFSTLTVSIDHEYLRIKFGYGIFKKKFKLKDISYAKAVKHHWYQGWGIRLWFWPPMTIYNVSGFDLIEIRMKKGRRIRIGTDEPKALEQALKQSI